MEKYGFIYVWFDRKRKMFYVGCHWGTIDDGYICSSTRMRKAFRRRPQDFKRRIVKTGIERDSLLIEEYKWLNLIPKNELGKRYYNLHNHHFGHWSNDEENRLTTRQKLSESIKTLHQDPVYRQRFLEGRKKLPPRTQEAIQKSAAAHLGTKHSEETKKKMSESQKRIPRRKWTKEEKEKRKGMFAGEKNPFYGKTHTDEFRKILSEKTSARLKGKVPKNIDMFKGSFWWNNGIINRRSKSCPGEDWIRGTLKKS